MTGWATGRPGTWRTGRTAQPVRALRSLHVGILSSLMDLIINLCGKDEQAQFRN